MQSKPQEQGAPAQTYVNKTQKEKASCEDHVLYTIKVILYHYDDSTDCKASCCCGCKEDHVEANTEGGNVV